MSSLEQRVRDYVCTVLPSVTNVAGVVRFRSGERHRAFHVSVVDDGGRPHDVVVRVGLEDDAAERAQAAREAAVLRHVDGLGAPRLLDHRPSSEWFDAPVLCVTFAAGGSHEVADAPPEDLERLGAVVARLHGRPTDALAPSIGGAADADEYRRERIAQVRAYLPSVRDPLPAHVQARVRQAVAIIGERVPTSRAPLVLLHGDVARSNVVWADPDPVLIDWEYARLGDRADEVAYVSTQNALDRDRRDAFWRGYERHAGADVAATVAEDLVWWEPVTRIGSVLWWIERWARRTDADDADRRDPTVPEPARSYLDEALRLLDRT